MGKNPEWTVDQIRLAVEPQLEPGLTRRQRLARLARPAHLIAYQQWRNKQARRSHRKTALRRLRAHGIRISTLPSCHVRL